MEKLNFPTFEFRFKNKENKRYIWDIVRKKYILLTPEEWVRQHVLHLLHHIKGYPLPWMNVEKQFTINGLHKRADIVVFGTNLTPYIIVECKAPHISITQNTFDQIARYNLSLQADYLMLTNGIQHFFCRMDFKKQSYIFLTDIPNHTSHK